MVILALLLVLFLVALAVVAVGAALWVRRIANSEVRQVSTLEQGQSGADELNRPTPPPPSP